MCFNLKFYILLGCLIFPTTLRGVGPSHLELLPWSQLSLEGKSPNHAFQTHTSSLEIESQFDSKLSAEEKSSDLFYRITKVGKIKQLILSIPVRSIKSGVEELDHILQSALKPKEFPKIIFTMKQYEFLKSFHPDFYPVKLRGTLSVAGKSRDENLILYISFKKEAILIIGKHDIFMTDFDIQPPRVPVLNYPTNEKITIRFELYLKLIQGD